MPRIWEFTEQASKMPLTASIFLNVLQSSGFSSEERLVREALQNSVDAHRPGSVSPVSVRIESKLLVGPSKKSLVKAIGLRGQPFKRRKQFGLPDGNALHSIRDADEPLPTLIIADSHTHGLPGAWNGTEPNDHFGRLVVNLGVDDKAEAAEFSGGSYGFGKTVYAKASGIGVVVFYSAISEFPKWRKCLILLSFLDNSSARPVQIGGVDVNICHSRVDRSPRTPAVQFAIPPRGDHFVAHGRALWKLTGRGRTERAHRAVENAVRFPRASTGPFPSSQPRKTPKGP